MAKARSHTIHCSDNAVVIVSIAVIAVAALLAVQLITGVSLSMRGTTVYNALPSYSEPLHGAADSEEEESRIPTTSTLLEERLCERVVKYFANDDTVWERINERIMRRLGFECSR